MVIAVYDTNVFINREAGEVKITKGYVTTPVYEEIKDNKSVEYLQLNMINIEVRDARDEFIKRVNEIICGKNTLLSTADISVVALMLELHEEKFKTWIGPENAGLQEEIVCITKDNGIRNVLAMLDLIETSATRIFKYRCYACCKLYEKDVDFCRECGYSTITRVSVIVEDGKERICLKRNYNAVPKQHKTNKGVIILSEDVPEYSKYRREKNRREKDKKRSWI
ncbi:nob1 [Nucleospora cyclopteri]